MTEQEKGILKRKIEKQIGDILWQIWSESKNNKEIAQKVSEYASILRGIG